MMSSLDYKIKIRVMAPTKGMNYVDESCVNWNAFNLQNADRRWSRKEFRINKKSHQSEKFPEE